MKATACEIDVSEWSPTETLVYRGLQNDGPMTITELVAWTGRGRRSVHRAISHLESEGIVGTSRTTDLRETRYHLDE